MHFNRRGWLIFEDERVTGMTSPVYHFESARER